MRRGDFLCAMAIVLFFHVAVQTPFVFDAFFVHCRPGAPLRFLLGNSTIFVAIRDIADLRFCLSVGTEQPASAGCSQPPKNQARSMLVPNCLKVVLSSQKAEIAIKRCGARVWNYPGATC